MTPTHPNTLIALDLLDLSPMNPRQTADADDIRDIAESIDKLGLISPLVVMPTGERFEVCAGGQRWRALRLLAEDGRAPELIPCILVDDSALAAEIAMAENTARRDLSPIDQIAGFAAAARRGASPRDIALAFGVRETTVRQRLKLADLGEDALGALRGRKITLDQAEALTLCTDPVLAVTLLDRARSGDHPNTLRRMAIGERPRTSDGRVRIVGLDAYKSAGGTLVEDLFGDDTRIEDPALLDDLFADAVRAQAEALRAEGWLWADYIEANRFHDRGRGMQRIMPAGPLSEDGTPQFTPEQRAVAGVYFSEGWRDDGWRISRHDAFIRPQDEDSARAYGILPPRTKPAAEPEEDDGPGFSAALLADLRAVELHAAQLALSRHPEFAADLAAFCLSHLSPRFANPLAITTGPTKNAPSVDDGFTPAETITRQDDHARPGTDLPTAWRAFRALPSDARFQMLAEAIAARLTHGADHNALWPLITLVARPLPRSIWTPTESNCFGRMRAAQLDAAHADIITDETARAAFRAMKRSEKVKFLHLLFNGTEAQRRGVQGWTEDIEDKLANWWPLDGGKA